MQSGSWPRFIVVMGVSGTGKSSVGASLAHALDAAFMEGDSLHPPENIAAMSAGKPLTDAMRLPWLDAICDAAVERGAGVISRS